MQFSEFYASREFSTDKDKMDCHAIAWEEYGDDLVGAWYFDDGCHIEQFTGGRLSLLIERSEYDGEMADMLRFAGILYFDFAVTECYVNFFNTTERLTTLWESFCNFAGIECVSADEALHDMLGAPETERTNSDVWNADFTEWFITRWNEIQEQEDNAQ